MALKNYVFDLSSVVSDGSGGAISIKSDNEVLASVDATVLGSEFVKVDSFGYVKLGSDGKVDFVASAGLPVGEYSVSVASGKASLSSFNAAAATKGITFKAYQAASSFVGTSGDDTILISEAASVKGGAGADKFVVVDNSKASKVEDYSFAQGDVVSLAASVLGSAYGLNSAGEFTVGSATVQAADNAGWRQVDLINGNAGEVELFTASGSKNSVTVALSEKAGLVVVDATNVKKATVDLGTGDDTVSVATAADLTLKVGRADGNNELKVSLDASDTLQITDGEMSEIKASADSADIKIAATTIKGALDTANEGSVKVQFGSEAAKKLVYNVKSSGATINYAEDAAYYLGVNGKLSVGAGFDDVSIDVAKNASGVAEVDVTKANGVVNIVAAGNTSIDASGAAHSDATWTFDLTAYGKNTHDELKLTGSAGKDVVKLSTTGGGDSITGFKADEDVIELTGVSELTKDTFNVEPNNKITLKDGAEVNFVAGDLGSKDVNIVIGDKTEKVAFAGNGISTGTKVTKDTTKVINTATTAATVNFVTTDESEGAVGVIDLKNSGVGQTQYIGKFNDVTVDTDKSMALVIGNEENSIITVNGEKSAVVWAGEKSDNTITLSNATAQDIVWTGGLDGSNTVNNFGNNDVIYTYDSNLTAQDVASKLSIKKGTGNLVFATSDTASLTLNSVADNTKMINVMGVDEKGYKVAVGSEPAVTYNQDADILLTGKDGTLVVNNTAVAEGTVTAIDLSGALVNDKIYVGVKDIDASASAGSFLLIGDNTDEAVLKGGYGTNGNAIWGGGNASQTMRGTSDVTDIFWFGKTDGSDTAANFETAKDIVFLYNATDINEVELGLTANNANVIFSATGSTLNLGGIDDKSIANVTFMLNDGAGAYKYYNYDATSKTFVEKK